MGRAGVLRSVSPGVATHTAPSLTQVVAVDLDEGLNGLVSYRMQVGMPRMDFLINSSSGVVVTTTELDRERIAEYQLRVVASDAGTPTKSSTSTLTIRGESDGGTSCYMLNTRARAQPGQCQRGGENRMRSCCPSSTWAQAALLIGHPPRLEPFSTAEPSLSPPSQKRRQLFSHPAAVFSAPEPGGSGLGPLPVSPSLILATAERGVGPWQSQAV